MPLLMLAAVLSAGPAGSPAGTLEGFLLSVMTSDSSAALSFISSEAFGVLEEMAAVEPENLSAMIAGFGVSVDPSEIPGMTPRDLMGRIVSSEALAGMFALLRYEIGEASVTGARALVPVSYSLLGRSGEVTVEMVREGGVWMVNDFFGSAPVR